MDDERDALVSLEPGQIVLGRNPLGIRRLGRGTVFLLSLLGVWGSMGTVNSVKEFPAVTTEASVRPNVSIKGLTRYAQFSAEIPDVGFKVAHR
jgi:hypothetical protein